MKIAKQAPPIARQATVGGAPSRGVAPSGPCGCPNACIGLCINGDTCLGFCV